MAVFASRQIPVLHVTVKITGSGNSSNCYAIINGTKQYTAGKHEVNDGDTITFGVYGLFAAYGFVKIDGTQVLKVTSASTETYDWTVPNGISTVEIAMYYSSSYPYGTITVTTA